MNKKTVILLMALLPLCLNSCIHRVIFPAERSVEPVTVKVMAVNTSSESLATGFVGTIESARTDLLNAPASGTLVSLPVREGEKVHKGQLVASIHSESLESAYSLARASLDQAEDAWKRVQIVRESGTISEVDYVKVETQLQQARASEAAAKAALERCQIKAPFDGVVEKVWPVKDVQITIAEPILRIVDLNKLEVHFSLPESDFGKYEAGRSVAVVVPAVGLTLPGTLAVKGITASALSRSYSCTVSLKKLAEGLMPGMVCKVFMDETSVKESIVLPSSTVLTDTKGRYVWTVKDGTVYKRYITVAGYSKNGILVSEGLEEGDQVIIEGRRKVSTGMTVKTVE